MTPPSSDSPFSNNHYSHHKIYSEFQRSLDEIRKQGSRSLSLSREPSEDYYYPYDSLREYFEDAPRLRNILRALLSSAFFLSFDERLLRRDYIKVFSILLGLKRGDAIVDFVGNDNFSDQHLPFNDPVAFAKLTGDNALYNDFSEYQWRFCTPKLEGFDKRWEPRRILPFEVLRELGRGVNRTYLVKVDRAYNELRNESESEPEGRDSLADHFVIKAFDPNNHEEFKQELSTYLRLKHESNDRITSMLRFYGSYSQNNISNVILEYANKGNLEQFLRETDPPTDLQHRKILWRNILKLLAVLTYLHNCEPGGICHHDITPRNILVSSRESCSLYDYSFKLADFGHSRRMQRILWDAQGIAEPRTRTYGAPECFSPADFDGKLQVSPEVDLFSLGCVLSEIATWFASAHGDISGSQRLDDYRDLRINSHARNFVDSDCFHNGLNVLPCVSAHHVSICSSLREGGDTITPAILRLVDSSMLQPKEKRRNARDLWIMSDLEIGHLARPADGKSSLLLESSGIPSFNSPPTPASTGSGHDASAFDKITRNASSTAERTDQSQLSDQLEIRLPNSTFQDHSVGSSVRSVDSKMTPQHRSAHISDTNETSHVASSSALPRLSSMTTQYNSTAQFGSIVEEGHDNRAPDAPALDVTSNRQYTSQASLPTQIGAPSSPSVADLESSRQCGMPTNTRSDPNMFVTQTRITAVQEESNLAQASSSVSSPPHPPPPNWPIETLHKLRRERKKLPHEWIADLKHRHFVFLADDSTSMIKHWPQATKVLHTLAYLVKGFDHNGLDLFFTHSEAKVRSARRSTNLHKSMRNHTPPNSPVRYTDIETSLGSFLDDYRRRIEDRDKRHHFGIFHCDVKRVAIIVLTDGRWQPDSDKSIAESLRRLALTLEECKRNPKQIGVQFIQFGDDENARARLAHLDRGLGFGEYDIVDTVPADGDGLKMLLGPINKWMDHIDERQPSHRASDPGSAGTRSRSTPQSSTDMSIHASRPQSGSPTSQGRQRSRPSNKPSLHTRTASTGEPSLAPL